MCAGGLAATSALRQQAGPVAPTAGDLATLSTLLDEARSALAAKDHALARTRASQLLERARVELAQHEDDEALEFFVQLGNFAHEAGDLRSAEKARRHVYDVYVRTRPDDDPLRAGAGGDLAVSLYMLGDLAGARTLFEKVLEVRTRTLPDDDPGLQVARMNLSALQRKLGDLRGALTLDEKVYEVYMRTLPDDHKDLQRARSNLALTLKLLGDLSRALALQESVLAVFSRTLPDDHRDVLRARANLAITVRDSGDLHRARALEEAVLEFRTRTLPDDHPDLQVTRLSFAMTLKGLGDLAGARALEERVLEVQSRTLPDDHPDVQLARVNLAGTLRALGELAAAATLEEKVLEVHSRKLRDDHSDLQVARIEHASTLYMQRDFQGARALLEKVLEVSARTQANENWLQGIASSNLAAVMVSQGDLAGARAILDRMMEHYLRTLPDDHPSLQSSRVNLAVAIGLWNTRQARLPEGHSEESFDGGSDASSCAALLAALARTQVRAACTAILSSSTREAEERCWSLAQKLGVCISFANGFGELEPLSSLASESFAFSEVTRGSALSSAALARAAAAAPEYDALRESLRSASDSLARLAQKGTTSEVFDRARVQREALERELVKLANASVSGAASGLSLDVETISAALAPHQAAVGFRHYLKVMASVRDELDATGLPVVGQVSVASLCAFVVRASRSHTADGAAVESPLTLVDLGPIAPIEELVRVWRDGLGVAHGGRGLAAGGEEADAEDERTRGVVLREAIFDPLLPALAGAQCIVVALDDVLHVVPLDALPLDEARRVGDRWQIETRATLSELIRPSEPRDAAVALVVFGDVDYDREEEPANTARAASTELAAAEAKPTSAAPSAQSTSAAAAHSSDSATAATQSARVLRGGAFAQGFSALPGTGVEARGIATRFTDRFGAEAMRELCEHAGASRARLIGLAPKARYLHIATHGWFAPESVSSWSDPEPLDKHGELWLRGSGVEQVKGLSPMLLCGLALAGANQPEDPIGRAPGLITADELSTLDLSNCELAVLSACDTNVGERRAGQGVASLQKALQMAGARSVITSLWKVPDEATKELMLDFYRRLWVEKKPKWQALWEAKTKLREAKDERGAPKYTTRDWAAWVLTGEPD
jgi:tetratricopeptide (TPR) repeat protein